MSLGKCSLKVLESVSEFLWMFLLLPKNLIFILFHFILFAMSWLLFKTYKNTKLYIHFACKNLHVSIYLKQTGAWQILKLCVYKDLHVCLTVRRTSLSTWRELRSIQKYLVSIYWWNFGRYPGWLSHLTCFVCCISWLGSPYQLCTREYAHTSGFLLCCFNNILFITLYKYMTKKVTLVLSIFHSWMII